MEEMLAFVSYPRALHFLHSSNLQVTVISLFQALLMSTFVALAFLLPSTKDKKWPPSPPRLPFIGNLHLLNKGGNLLSTMTQMGKTYGPVMTVWMGTLPLIVLTGHAPISEALVNQASNFSGRPPIYSMKYVTANLRSTISSPSNEHWTKFRRILYNNVLSPAHVALQSSSHQACMSKLIAKLEMEIEEKNGLVRPLHALIMMAVSFIVPLCFGLDFHDDEFLSKLEERIAKDISLLFLDLFPAARFFIPSSIRTERKPKSLRDDVLLLMLPLIRFAQSYREYFKRSAPSSFLNCLLEGKEELAEDNSELSDEEIAFNLHELFVLAVDSTSTAVEWALVYLISIPTSKRRHMKK